MDAGTPREDAGPRMNDAALDPSTDAASVLDVPSDAPSDALSDALMLAPDAGPRFLTTVEERVDHLGITRTTLASVGGTAFRDFTGNTLGAHANPLGASLATLSGAMELYLVGVSPNGGGTMVDLARPGIGLSPPHVIAQPAGALELATDPVPLAVHADDDGREEILVLDLRTPGGGITGVYALLIEDEVAGFTPNSGDLVGTWAGASSLIAVRRDVDGDTRDEAFLVARVGTNWEYRTYTIGTGVLGPASVGGPLADPMAVGTFSTFSLASGDTDGELGDEVAVLLNSRSSASGDARIVVFGQVGGVDTVLHRQRVRMAAGANIVAAGVALADIDADFRDEIVVAGTTPSPASDSYIQRVVMLDDGGATARFAPIYERERSFRTPTSPTDVRILETQICVARTSVPTALPEISGRAAPAGVSVFDPADDLLINNVLWEFSTVVVPATATPAMRATAMARAPRELFQFAGGSPTVSSQYVQFALGQLDSDGLPDAALLTYDRGIFVGSAAFQLRSRPLIGARAEITSTLPHRSRRAFRLTPANVDRDSIVVRHLEAEHVLRYSEPVILAVIAAPPCYNTSTMGQAIGSCSTSYGTTTSSSVSTDTTYGVSLGITTGFSLGGTPSPAQFEATYTARASASFGAGTMSSVTFSQSFNNGSAEDEVVATVFGLETFTYLVVSAPDEAPGSPTLVGERLIIAIPNQSGTTTSQYGASVILPSLRPSQAAALAEVFDHRPDDPLTHHRYADLNAYLAGLGVVGGQCDSSTPPASVASCGWFISPSQTVGSTAGPVLPTVGSSVSGSISVSTGTSASVGWGVSAAISLKLTLFGAIGGVEIGFSTDSDVTISHGSSLEYGFAMGSVDPTVFTPYSARLFAFQHTFDCADECLTFEVVNYTVDP